MKINLNTIYNSKMDNIVSYHILFQQKLFPIYESYTEEEKKIFIYTAINEIIPKEYPEDVKDQLLQEWTLERYTPIYHMARLSLHAIYFQIAQHPQFVQKQYIGFGMCDHIITINDFRKMMTILQSTKNAYCGSIIHPISVCFDVLSPDKWNNILIEPFNRFYPNNEKITLNDIIRQPVFLLSTFVVPTIVFIEMMYFIEKFCLRTIMSYTQWNTEHITGIIERCMGLYLAARCHQKRFDTIFQYKIEQYKEPVVVEEEPIDHNMPPEQAVTHIMKALLPLDESLKAKGKKISFISFGNELYKESVVRIEKEARQFGAFDKVKVYQESDLVDTDFWKEHGQFIQNTPHGYGCWIWKPYLILQSLRKLKDNDILVYTDAGCTIHPSGRQRFQNYVDIVRRSPFGIIAFHLQNHMEKSWTKMDVFKHFRASKNPRYTDSTQMIGGIIVMRKCDHVMKIVEEWYDTVCNHSLIDDTPSVAPNDPSFQAHRNDQSIFSILVKKHGAEYLADETYPPKAGIPFLATRIRK
jgi:hypothetical protein